MEDIYVVYIYIYKNEFVPVLFCSSRRPCDDDDYDAVLYVICFDTFQSQVAGTDSQTVYYINFIFGH